MNRTTFQIRPDDRALLNVLSAGASDPLPDIPEEGWEDLTESAFRLGVAAFLYRHLASCGFNPPPEIIDRLRHTYLSNTARNTMIFRKLSGILGTFAKKKIPVIALKGAALAEPFYGSPGSRAMGDIDLLVNRDDLLIAKELIEKARPKQVRRIPPEQEIEVWHHLSPFRENGGDSSLVIELHWRLLRPGFPCRETADLWARTGRERIAGVETATLGPEDLILYTCLHALEHGYTGSLKYILDLKVVLDRRGDETGWSRLAEMAEEIGAGPCVAMGISLARMLLLTTLPDGAGSYSERNEPDPDLLKAVLLQIFDSADHHLSAHLSRLGHADGVFGKAGIALGRLFPPRREIAARYGMPARSPLFPLLYMVHPFTVLRAHGRGGLDLLLGRETAAAADEANLRKDRLIKSLLGN